MQAPTAPGEDAPAREPDGRTCASCGAANGMTAAFCWRCYRPFGVPAAPSGIPVGAIGRPGTPAQAGWAPPYGAPRAPRGWEPIPAPVEAPRTARSLGTIVAVIVATLALIGGAYYLLTRGDPVLTRGDPVALPESVGGLGRVEGPQAEIVAETFRAQTEVVGIEGDIAMYGSGTPTVALMWIRDASVPTTDAAFDAFASGFDSGIGSAGALNRSRRTTETIGGVTYVCAPVESVAPGTICMWQDGDVFWLLFDFSGARFQAGQDLAVATHDAISG